MLLTCLPVYIILWKTSMETKKYYFFFLFWAADCLRCVLFFSSFAMHVQANIFLDDCFLNIKFSFCFISSYYSVLSVDRESTYIPRLTYLCFDSSVKWNEREREKIVIFNCICLLDEVNCINVALVLHFLVLHWHLSSQSERQWFAIFCCTNLKTVDGLLVEVVPYGLLSSDYIHARIARQAIDETTTCTGNCGCTCTCTCTTTTTSCK